MTNRQIQIFDEAPQDFSPTVASAGVLCYQDRQLLILQRALHVEDQPGTWCLPGGKIEAAESAREAAARELHEETGIEVKAELLEDALPIYGRMPNGVDYTFHLFRYRWQGPLPAPSIRPTEHNAGGWKSLEEVRGLPLMMGAGQLLDREFPN